VPAYSPAIGGFFLKTVFLGLLPSFVKNIFEKFAWRGYLAPRISSLGINDLAGHALAGLVWATWHVPYYLFFLDRASFSAYTSQSFTTFFPMLLAGVLAMSFVYGEILLLTHSVWPLLLLHTVSNAIGSPLLLNGLIRIGHRVQLSASLYTVRSVRRCTGSDWAKKSGEATPRLKKNMPYSLTFVFLFAAGEECGFFSCWFKRLLKALFYSIRW